MADNFNLRQFLTENKLTKNAKLLKEARVEGFDENQKAFEVSFINKYGGGDSRILNAETPEQAEEVFTNIFVNNPDSVQSIKSIKPYQVPAPKAKAEPQPGLEGVNYGSIELDGIDSDDYPDFVDAYVISAEFEDGTPLSEEELEQLTDELYQSGELADMAAQSLYEGKKKQGSSGDMAYTKKAEEGVSENKVTKREKYLTRLVENALGIDDEEEDFINPGNTPEEDINRKNYLKTFGTPPTTVPGEEMVQEKPLPKYENIEKLMQEIEHGTNEAAYKHKMAKMKEVAEMLEARVSSLEEGDGADFVDAKKVKQMKKDIMTLRKQAEKLEKEYDKKFGEKKAKKETQTENKMKDFNLRQFLTENKLTTNSKMLKEREFEDDEMEQWPDIQLSDDAREEIENAIETYTPEMIKEDGTDIIIDIIAQAIEELDGYETPEGYANARMDRELMKISRLFHSNKITLDHAVEKAVTAMMDPKNFED